MLQLFNFVEAIFDNDKMPIMQMSMCPQKSATKDGGGGGQKLSPKILLFWSRRGSLEETCIYVYIENYIILVSDSDQNVV